MLIFGHRGASAALPENTMPAFERAIRAGADGCEFDVRATRDRVPVLIHDRAIDRTTSGSGLVDELSLRELQAFDAGGGYPVPTLEELLAIVPPGFELDIELKQAGIEREVLAVLARFPHVDWSVSSFKWDALRAFRAAAPDAPLLPLSDYGDDALFDLAREIGARGVAIKHPSVTESVARRAHAERLVIIAWTVNDLDEARRLDALGVYALCTDDPEAMVLAFAAAD